MIYNRNQELRIKNDLLTPDSLILNSERKIWKLYQKKK